MREECTHFQSRTYASGEAARFCVLDLAPEAPWRCPENCPSYHRRLADVGWVHGSLVEPAIEDEPEGENVAQLLESAEEAVNEVAPGILAEVRAGRTRSSPSPTRRRVMTGTLAEVNTSSESPHRAPHETIRPNCSSASWAIFTRWSASASP